MPFSFEVLQTSDEFDQERAELEAWFTECDQEEVDIGNVEFMLNHIDANIADEDGNTALHYAAAYGNVELIAVLFSHCAATRVTNCMGVTPLMQACRHGRHSAVVKLLEKINKEEELTHVNWAGYNARDLAGMSGKPSIIQALDDAIDRYRALMHTPTSLNDEMYRIETDFVTNERLPRERHTKWRNRLRSAGDTLISFAETFSGTTWQNILSSKRHKKHEAAAEPPTVIVSRAESDSYPDVFPDTQHAESLWRAEHTAQSKCSKKGAFSRSHLGQSLREHVLSSLFRNNKDNNKQKVEIQPPATPPAANRLTMLADYNAQATMSNSRQATKHHNDAPSRVLSPSISKRKLSLDSENVDDVNYYGWIIRAEAAAHARRLLTITRDTGYDSGQSDAHTSTGNAEIVEEVQESPVHFKHQMNESDDQILRQPREVADVPEEGGMWTEPVDRSTPTSQRMPSIDESGEPELYLGVDADAPISKYLSTESLADLFYTEGVMTICDFCLLKSDDYEEMAKMYGNREKLLERLLELRSRFTEQTVFGPPLVF